MGRIVVINKPKPVSSHPCVRQASLTLQPPSSLSSGSARPSILRAFPVLLLMLSESGTRGSAETGHWKGATWELGLLGVKRWQPPGDR